MSKVFTSFDEAIQDLKDGDTIIVGGFGLCGIPEKAIEAILRKGTKNLTVVSNNCGVDDWGLGLLLVNKQISKIIASYVGENKTFEQQFLNGEIEVELTPQGTLAERIRAGGAGIPAFYTATGVGTPIAEGKPTKVFDGKTYIEERAIVGDFAFVKAWKGDKLGNLVYRKTARNFNPLAAMAGKITIAEVEELVEVGELDPDQIHTPSVYVQRILVGDHYEKRIERKTTRKKRRFIKMTLTTREKIVKRAVKEIKDGMNVNLGIGMPTLVANEIPIDYQVLLQSENGLLGIGPYPTEDEVDPDLINAGKETVTAVKGAAFFDSAESFAMIRGGHIDLAILGGMEVSEKGDLANWMIPGKMVKGMGGAMDLVQGAKRVVVIMEHLSKKGEPKVRKECTLPLTGQGVVDRLITELAVFDFTEEGMVLIEKSKDISLEELKSKTEAEYSISPNLIEW